MNKSADQKWLFYIVRCKDGSLYSGITNDLVNRLKEHNKGTGAKYTSGRRPVTLVYREKCGSLSEALKREAQVKNLSKGKKEQLLMTQSRRERKSCDWPSGNPLMLAYHDEEWGVPVHDDRKLFESLTLSGAQAGLSWQTVLNKRENYRKAFDAFDVRKIARYGEKDIARLLSDPGIIRNRLKIAAAIQNAKKVLEIQKEFGSFDKYIWQFVSGEPINNRIRALAEIPATSKESDVLSNDLRQRGFKFVGSTICYAFMQAVGMVNDHMIACFRYSELTQERKNKD